MRSKLGGELAGFVKTMAFALTLALVPRVVLCQPFTIPSGSMEPTLLVGLAGIAGFIVIAIYMAMFGMYAAM